MKGMKIKSARTVKMWLPFLPKSVWPTTGICNEYNLDYAKRAWEVDIRGYVFTKGPTFIDATWYALARAENYHKGIYELMPLSRYGSKVYITFTEGDINSLFSYDIVLFTLPYILPAA